MGMLRDTWNRVWAKLKPAVVEAERELEELAEAEAQELLEEGMQKLQQKVQPAAAPKPPR